MKINQRWLIFLGNIVIFIMVGNSKMKRKKGFAFIETIVTTVVLATALLFLYNSYSSIIKNHKERLYYDDVAYLYKTKYIKYYLEKYSGISEFKERNKENSDYFFSIGIDSTDLFKENYANEFNNILGSFHVSQVILVKSSFFNDCATGGEDDYCKKLEEKNYGYKLRNYINTLNSNDYEYYLVVEYSYYLDEPEKGICSPEIGENCVSFYASLGI